MNDSSAWETIWDSRYNGGMRVRHAAALTLALFALLSPARAEELGGLKRRAVFGAQIMPHEGGGVVLGQVMASLPAEAAGLHAGDVITAVGGKAVNSPQQFVEMMKAGSGDVEFTIERHVALRDAPLETAGAPSSGLAAGGEGGGTPPGQPARTPALRLLPGAPERGRPLLRKPRSVPHVG